MFTLTHKSSRLVYRVVFVVQLLSRVPHFVTPWTAECQASLSFTISQSLLKLMSMPSNRLVHCRPLLILPSVFPSIKIFSSKLTLHIMWPKYQSISFSISPFNEYSELISFRIDWFDLLAIQWSLRSLLQQHSLKASILWCSAFFMVGFLGGSDIKSVCLQCRRPGFNPWVGKIPWRRKWQLTPVLLPGKFHGLRSLVGYSPWGHKELDMTEQLHFLFLSSLWSNSHIHT